MIDYQCMTCNYVFQSIAGVQDKECPNCELDATNGGALPCSMLPDFSRDLPVLSKEDAWRKLGVDVDDPKFMKEATELVEEIMDRHGINKAKWL